MTRYLKFPCALVLLACATLSGAQPYPARAVRIIVPFAPAGGTDILARSLAQKMGESTGQQFIVDNRAGANSIIGTEIVAKSAPDGHTLLFTTNIYTINPWLHQRMPYNSETDFAPITLAGSAPTLLAVHPSIPAKTVRELVALAKSKPGQLTLAAAGSGTPSHLSGEFLNNQEVRQRLAAQGFDAGGTTPEQFADIIRQDLARWQKVIAKANIRAE